MPPSLPASEVLTGRMMLDKPLSPNLPTEQQLPDLQTNLRLSHGGAGRKVVARVVKADNLELEDGEHVSFIAAKRSLKPAVSDVIKRWAGASVS